MSSGVKRLFLINDEPPSAMAFFVNFALLCVVLAPIAVFVMQGQPFRWSVLYAYRSVFISGWLTTVVIAAAAFVISSCIGVIFALAKRSKIRLLRMAANLYIEVFRGTPLLVQLLFIFYIIANAIHLENRFMLGCAILSFFSGAYIAEIIRSGIESVRESQIQSARSMGFSKRQIYSHVIFPQAFRQVLPPLAGQFASLIKDSSLLSILGISEFTFSAEQVNSATYSTLESFFPLAIGYLILTLPISMWSKRLEKRFKYET